MFYMTNIHIYAYPEYNESIKLMKFSFEVFANQIFVGTIFPDERGDASLDEFPMPSLYNLTPFRIDASGNVRGVDMRSNVTVDLAGIQEYILNRDTQKLSELTMNIYDTHNRRTSADVEMIYVSEGNYIVVLKEKIEGVGTFDTIPQGSCIIKFRHFSSWGIVVEDSFDQNISELVPELSFVLSVSEYTVLTRNLINDPLDDVFVKLYIIAGGNVMDFNIIGISSGDSILFDDMPAENAMIIINNTRAQVEKHSG